MALSKDQMNIIFTFIKKKGTCQDIVEDLFTKYSQQLEKYNNSFFLFKPFRKPDIQYYQKLILFTVVYYLETYNWKIDKANTLVEIVEESKLMHLAAPKTLQDNKPKYEYQSFFAGLKESPDPFSYHHPTKTYRTSKLLWLFLNELKTAEITQNIINVQFSSSFLKAINLDEKNVRVWRLKKLWLRGTKTIEDLNQEAQRLSLLAELPTTEQWPWYKRWFKALQEHTLYLPPLVFDDVPWYKRWFRAFSYGSEQRRELMFITKAMMQKTKNRKEVVSILNMIKSYPFMHQGYPQTQQINVYDFTNTQNFFKEVPNDEPFNAPDTTLEMMELYNFAMERCEALYEKEQQSVASSAEKQDSKQTENLSFTAKATLALKQGDPQPSDNLGQHEPETPSSSAQPGRETVTTERTNSKEEYESETETMWGNLAH